MDHTLPLPSNASHPAEEDVEDPQATIARYFAEIDELREKMRQSDAVIAESRAKTKTMLEEIALALAELKAA